MRTQTKSAFLVLAVLVLGIVIGIFASGAMQNRRMRSLARMRTGPGFAEMVERAVQPRNEEQRAEIRAVLDGAAPRFAQMFERNRREMGELADSVMAELEAVLDDDQIERLRSMHLRMRQGPPEGRRGRPGERRPGGPPPDEARPPGVPPPERPFAGP